MIQFVFTVDYEIYGNGRGSLKDLVFEPAEKLKAIFRKHDARFVAFPDVAELELIDVHGTDPSIGSVKEQLKGFHNDGFELGLHIHPWWYHAKLENGAWVLNQREYNLCTLPADRIRGIVDRAIGYLRQVLGVPGFSPLSFRAGHLLFQPTQPLGDILAARGVRMDSSVYRGGLWRRHKLDYRRAPKNSAYWPFHRDVALPDPQGRLLEIPISTRQDPFWKLLTSKRVGLQQAGGSTKQLGKKFLDRFSDFLRFRYPHKLDLGQMHRDEMNGMIEALLREDQKQAPALRPVVAILHTKDPIDYDAVDAILGFLGRNGIEIVTLADVHRRIRALRGGGAESEG